MPPTVPSRVDTHCADSGQTPTEAFGDPVTYVESLIATHVPAAKGPRERVGRPMAQVFTTMTGAFCVLSGAEGLAHGGRAALTAGQLLAVALGTALAVVIVLLPQQ